MVALLDRLRQRKLVQWALAYLAAAWIALQLVDVLSPIFGLSIRFQRILVVTLAFGLVVAVVLAWYHGERGKQRATRAEVFVLAGVLALAATALTSLWANSSSGEESIALPQSSMDARSVAVLPFSDLSPDNDQEYFGDGIAEELTSTVARLPGLSVAARTSAFSFKRSDLDVREIGRRLGVATVVEGSLRKEGDALRIDARIVGVANGFPLWTERFEASASEIFDVQDRIARAVAEALQIELGGGEDELRLPGQTNDHIAQDLYLRGRFAWNLRTRAGLEEAVEAFTASLARDADYTRALMGLADAYAIQGFYDYRPPAEAFPLAREAAARAAAREPGLAEPHATLGYVALYHDWDWDVAEREFLRAIELNPGYAVAHQWYGNYLVAMGRFDEAYRETRLASELDPLSMIAHAAVGWALYYGGEYREAISQLEGSLARDSEFLPALLWIGQALSRLGRLDEAAVHIERHLELAENSGAARAALARLRADQGRSDEAREILRKLETEAGGSYVPSYEIGVAWMGLGESARALEWLERARSERSHSLAFLVVDPQLSELHGIPAFRQIRASLDLE